MIVKICGIVTPEDAAMVSKLGADWIGILLSPLSKRYVGPSLAAEIAAAARENGALPVGVFVEEDIAEITQHLKNTQIQRVQLHGKKAKTALGKLPSHISTIFALGVNQNGEKEDSRSGADFILYDNLIPGSGESFPWKKFRPDLNTPWLLSGGLNVDNIQLALNSFKPHGVDVSTGVSISGKLNKDRILVEKFIRLAKEETNV